MLRKLAILLFILLSAAPASALTKAYDVVIFGAGTGGSSAAVQAGRMGASVALIEETNLVGGQIAAGVSTMDDVGRTRSGIYGEFIDRVRSYYGRIGVTTNICLWGGDTIAAEPLTAHSILTEMIKSTGNVDLYISAVAGDLVVENGSIRSARITTREGEELEIKGAVYIDATERGDIIPKAGADYRVGNSMTPQIDERANVQDITYVAVVKRYPQGLPPELVMPGPPPGYEKHLAKFRRVVQVDGNSWPGAYPFDIPSHNAYRALPDPDNRALIIGDVSETWPLISKTCINWANDWPGRPGDEPGLSVRYIEDMEYRRQAEREAMSRTLAFIWYMQSELGMTDWSVDIDQGYSFYFSNEWGTADDPLLPDEFAPILRYFPPMPYVREGRRIVGLDTLTDADIKRDVSRGRAYRNYRTSIALGEYPVDVHGSHLDRYMEHDLGETTDSFPKTWVGNQGVFQVPVEVLISRNVDNLIAAEKNISVSRMVNGAIRLHPITMHTGQAAGALAALAAARELVPSEVPPLALQTELWRWGCDLALDKSDDAPRGDPYRAAVEWASVYEVLPKISRSYFGVNLPVRTEQLRGILRRAGIGYWNGDWDGHDFITKRMFLDGLKSAAGVPDLSMFDRGELDLSLKRGDAVDVALHCASMW